MTSLLDALDKKFPKYDIALKIMFAYENSSLPDMLGVPEGIPLREEFPDFNMTRVDALIFSDAKLYHVEFQSSNSAKMLGRMLDYRNSLMKHFAVVGKVRVEDIVQKLLYVGNPDISMKNEFEQSGLVYRYDLHDVREFHEEWEDDLLESEYPIDWIIEMIARTATSDEDWLELGRRIFQHRRDNEEYLPQIPGVLLVASTLRKVSRDTREEFLNMFTMSIKDDPLLREIYEQGNELEAKRSLLKTLKQILDEHEVLLEEDEVEFVAEQNEEFLRQLIVDLAVRGLGDEVMARMKPAGSSPRPF